MVTTAADAAPLVLVLTSEADAGKAEALAQAVLEARLAACVSVTAVRSLYRWQGALEQAREVQLLIKTHPAQLEQLRALVHRLHSYDTPEWICWPAQSSGGYGSWLEQSCRP